MARASRVPADYFDFDDLTDIMDGIAARRSCAVAGSAEPMTRPDYRAKKHSRPARARYERRADKRQMAEGV